MLSRVKVNDLAVLLSRSKTNLYNHTAREGRMGRAVLRFGRTIRLNPRETAGWLRGRQG